MSPHELRSAQEHCRALARREAANFYWGFIALPRDQRAAIYGLYSFARQVDDAVDRGGGAPALARQRTRLRECAEGRATDPVLQVLGWARARYGLPDAELEAVVAGVEMDIRPHRYESYAELESYCRLVASAIGRMCVRIFGFRDDDALARADRLGIALQLINVLRDVREDAGLGRIYLPLDALRRHGIAEARLLELDPGPGWRTLVAEHVDRARAALVDGLEVTSYIPRRARACVRTMAGIYARLLERIAADPDLPLRDRASLTPAQKLTVMAGAWLRG